MIRFETIVNLLIDSMNFKQKFLIERANQMCSVENVDCEKDMKFLSKIEIIYFFRVFRKCGQIIGRCTRDPMVMQPENNLML